MLAFKGTTVCGAHGGFSIWAKQGKLKRSGKGQVLKAERAASVEGRVAAAPSELARMQIYQQAAQRMRMKLVQAYGTPVWAQWVKRAIEDCV
jgi:hypothetical protein